MKKGSLELGEKPSAADLEKLRLGLSFDLPESYINFLQKHNGASGDLPVQPCYFQLWRIDEIIENNQDYEIQDYLPGYFGIGGNGGGEFLAIHLENQKIFTIPFIPMDEENAWLVAESFEDLEKILGFTTEE